MHVDVSKTKGPNGRVYSRALLRTSFRDEQGKVRHQTVANLSQCTPAQIQAIRLALNSPELVQQTHELRQAQVNGEPTTPQALASQPLKQGASAGAILTLAALAKELGITQALGEDADGQLALWQIIARALDQGSRLSSVRLARDLQAATLLDLPSFNEDRLYTNLAWLAENQESIEDRLFAHRYGEGKPQLYLYDVTSTYLEGDHNALAAFGYNRDKKSGKKQIVIGLLGDAQGLPVSIQAFLGNTVDPQTVSDQVTKLHERFRAPRITLVGDRGMLRGPQIEMLEAAGMDYITAISKPQINTLLRNGVIQMTLFDNELAEIIVDGNDERAAQETDPKPAKSSYQRYILRRNPERQKEMAANREARQTKFQSTLDEANAYLNAHAKAHVTTQEKRLRTKLVKLRLSWIELEINERQISIKIKSEELAEEKKLDGCYVIKTNHGPETLSKEEVHERYKSLSQIESAFRRSKTVELEMRPVHVRLESSTRGHFLVVMLAYVLMEELGRRWAGIDKTVAEGLSELNTYCVVEAGEGIVILPTPRDSVAALIEAARIPWPERIKGHKKPSVATKTQLPKHRSKRSK